MTGRMSREYTQGMSDAVALLDGVEDYLKECCMGQRAMLFSDSQAQQTLEPRRTETGSRTYQRRRRIERSRPNDRPTVGVGEGQDQLARSMWLAPGLSRSM
eukprot:1432686-Heterocapsa_arctica.AAC.1